MQNPYANQKPVDREAVVMEYAPMVKHIANRLAARLPASIQLDDLVQAGMIGLLEAMEKYDAQKGTKFKTYAEIRVKGAMLDDLRSKDWIPRSVRDNSDRLESAFSELRAENIDHPTDKQLAQQLGLKPRDLPEFLNKSKPIPLLSLENLGSFTASDERLDILETLSDPEVDDAVDRLMGAEAQELLVQALEELPEKERMVLSLYYNEELNLKEIGAVLDVTESRASQLRTRAIAMLRSLMREYIDS